MKAKLLLEYDGKNFVGWQQQPEHLSVQQELERALKLYLDSEAKKQGLELPERIVVTGSGRTDAGVHARGQVASFAWPEGLPFDGRQLMAALNGISRPEISVLSAEQADNEFDARRSPHIKRYSYFLFAANARPTIDSGKRWHIPQQLQIAEMIRAANCFVGTHDFSSFQASDCGASSTVRTVLSSEFSRLDANTLVYSIEGNGFLKHMVRTIVGTLVEVGLGKLSAEDIPAIITANDRTRAGQTAPAHGLLLEWVRYRGE